MHLTIRVAVGALLVVAVATTAHGQQARGKTVDPAAVQQLNDETGSSAAVHPATGAVRFVRVDPARGAAVRQRSATSQDKRGRALGFLRRHARAFGLIDPSVDLSPLGESKDAEGFTHLAYAQQYRGIPVFGARLNVHFDPADTLSVVNGIVVPDIDVDPTPSRGADEAGRIAFTSVAMQTGAANLAAANTRVLIFREGLAQGVAGPNHLAWEVEVTNGTNVREFVYVDAHTGKIIDQITGTYDGMYRRAYDGRFLPTAPPEYPLTPYWIEGQAFPTASAEADNMLLASKDIYDTFWRAFARDSFDAAGKMMDSIFDRGYQCPNASWNGTFISFCQGTTADDVTAHEWGHAYTEYTDNLIYQWQPGALNESYSDIWGEVVDQLNGRGTDSPGGLRSADSCTAFTTFPTVVRINSPAAIAGVYSAGAALFGAPVTATGLTGDVVLANDGTAAPTFGCATTPWVNAADVAGKIALVDRGTCTFAIKVKNAQNNGALGVIVANNANALITMSGVDPTITIPALSVTLPTGNTIKAQLAVGVNATLRRNAPSAIDTSYRWLMGEDASAFGGAIRDMWNPTCYSNPGKVTDSQYYVCSTADGGGVHTNSGIPNHGFALITDGGTFNGHTVTGLGVTKSAHIYYRAQSVYQGPASDFADHADALEQSCADLIGATLADLTTGLPSADVITPANCAQVHEATLAVELRTPPAFCNFQPLLAKNPPDRCGPDTTQVNLFFDDFEQAPAGWQASHAGVTADFTPRDWEWSSMLPDRAGHGFFAIDPPYGTCASGGDESGVLHLDSPAITVPEGAIDPLLTFDHWVATEGSWDGGNLKISVNGGPWQLVAKTDFTFNAYNAKLASAPSNTNPMAGEDAFTGTDAGAVDGSWGRSHVRLAPYAAPGQTVRLRWDFGTDGCGAAFGWYLDDVTLYACTSNAAPEISVADTSVVEGNTGFTSGAFTISLSHASASPVTVRYRLGDAGTAKRGVDYVPFDGLFDRTVVIAPLSLTATVPMRIKGDLIVEPDEWFSISLREPVNATLGVSLAQCTIVNDDHP